MYTSVVQDPVLGALRRRPSRASAAAVGNHYLLHDAPVPLQLRGLDVLAEMVCDWSVATLGEIVSDAARHHEVRRHAISKLRDLLLLAVGRGYPEVNAEACWQLSRFARAGLRLQVAQSRNWKLPAVEELRRHVRRAVNGGYFEPLPDF